MKKTAPIVRSEDIQFYLKDLKKIPVITHEREIEIFRTFKNKKDLSKTEKQKLVDEIVKGNLRFVISIAKTYQNQGLDVVDLISEGNIGLIKAVDRYDIDSGFKFISYAVWWIRQQILYALNEYARTIRVPSNVIQEAQKLKKNESSQEDQYFIEHSETYLNNIPTTVDLFKEINEDGDTLLELIINPNAESPEKLANSDEDLKHRIKYMLSFLDERESAIIDGYFGLSGIEKNLEDLGEEFGRTKERIRQLKDKAIKKLRNESFSLLKYL
ncbi:MAG: sigma-70 family RNA polymerase sigma factor [Candidatus Fonsibacter ubiquis]